MTLSIWFIGETREQALECGPLTLIDAMEQLDRFDAGQEVYIWSVEVTVDAGQFVKRYDRDGEEV